MRKFTKWVKHVSSICGEVFNPLIPAFIIVGIATGIASLMAQISASNGYSEVSKFIYALLRLLNDSFTPFMSAWVGYLSCQYFGGTPICGGIIGMITCSSGIDEIASILSLEKILYSGAGGIIAAFVGAFIFAKTEILIRRVFPASLRKIFPPLISMSVILVPYIIFIIPLAGVVSQILCSLIDLLSSGNTMFVRIFTGFFCASIFLPANIAGVQHSIIALYPIQLEKYGYITLYPVFSMAGGAQVGAGFAIWIAAKRKKDYALAQVAISATLPGMLGVASPLLYGVTLPHPKALLASCLGAGVGGAFIMCSGIASSGWGASGLLAIPMMVGIEKTALQAMIIYALGLLLSACTSFLLCLQMIRKDI